MSHNESKFGKKKSGNKFSREKKYASSEEDILLAQHNSDLYNEVRSQERHHRRTLAGLEDVTKDNVQQKEDVTKEDLDEPVNKYDIKKFGSTEEAGKYLYNCHTCNRKIKKNSEFCSDKCKEYILNILKNNNKQPFFICSEDKEYKILFQNFLIYRNLQ